MATIHWGILSTAKIGREHVIPAIQAGKNCTVAAIASRRREQAQQVAEALSIPKTYGSYEELLADDEIQAIYNPLPNHLHIPWSLKAVEAGKHILCEKPIALTADEAAPLLDACQKQGVLLMEAFMYRMHTQWVTAKQMVKDGKIGTLKAIQTFFSYTNLDPGNIRNKADIGGGGLMDIGCYPISAARFLFDAEPTRVMAMVERDPTFKTDVLTSGMMQFDAGQAAFTCSTQLTPYQRVNIFGTEGRIEIMIPFNAPETTPTRIYHEANGRIEEIELAVCNQYQAQAELFSQAILEGSAAPTPPQDAIANMRVIDAMFRSEQSGQWEAV